tara:strand:- start:137 stop:418 length:282 start_codon:yes stop_codon:yes gene_type:complete
VKITKEQLKEIIKEELENVLEGQSPLADLVQHIKDDIDYISKFSDDVLRNYLEDEMKERGIDGSIDELNLMNLAKNAKRNFEMTKENIQNENN